MGRFFKSDREVANERFEQILDTISNQDEKALKKLFSQKAITDTDVFDKSVIKLFDFFQGKVVEYDDRGALGVDGGKNDDGTGRNWKSMQSTYDVETSEGEYRFAIKEYTMDTADRDNIGIYSLYIIKAEDSDLEFAYWGGGKWVPGINIETKN